MNTSATFFGHSSPVSWFNFDLEAPSPTQDADLLQQLFFLPGLKEILTIRQVHALEHATVWLLSETRNIPTHPTRIFPSTTVDDELLSGFSTEQGFYLYGEVNISDLRRAVTLAQDRLVNGEWDLAIHPRCGTNLSVALLLTAGLAAIVPLLLPFRPIEQLIGFGLATTTAAELAPELGSIAQRYVTTSVPFNLEIGNITNTVDPWGSEAHFVRTSWRE
jgi:hypothetical protein